MSSPVSCKREAEGGDMHRKGGGTVTTETKILVMWPQVKERQQLPQAGRGEEQSVSSDLQRECRPANTSALTQRS